MDKKGKWNVAPSYDLTYSSPTHGHHSTTVAGESRQPTLYKVKELAKHFSVIDKVDQIVDEVKSTIDNWNVYAETAGVSNQSQDIIYNAYKTVAGQFFS